MVSKLGKLFQNIQTGKIQCFPYVLENDYYSLIKEAQNCGFRQCIITSDIMIQIIEFFMLKCKAELISIDFMIEDELLQDEINFILQKMKTNLAYWSTLKQKLFFISQNDSIDIKNIKLRCIEDKPYLLSIQVNGIINISQNAYEDVVKTVIKITEEFIK